LQRTAAIAEMWRHESQMTDAELQSFYAAGFSKAQALEVVLGAGFSLLERSGETVLHASQPSAFDRLQAAVPVGILAATPGDYP
jgi:hypothetical protein